MLTRTIEKTIRDHLGNGRVQIIYGPRRIGKTTLAKQLLANTPYLYLDCDLEDVRRQLAPRSLRSLEALVGDYTHIIIDEAQRLSEAGLTLKIMIDAHPEWTIIATGSSSFDLSGMIREPLTGRANEYTLLPLTSTEITNAKNLNLFEIEDVYRQLMVYGGYPATINMSRHDASELLLDITEKYIFRDALIDIDLKQRGVITSLLYALAVNSSGEISYQRLADDLAVSSQTIQKYVYLLEQAFIVYALPVGRGGLYNLSSRRKRKLYFFDTGIRNAILKNFDPIDLRPDKGALWENLCVNEIEQKYSRRFGIFSYWRGDYGEVDLLVRTNGTDYAYEFKYGNNRTFRTPKHFKEAYKGVEVKIVSPENLKSTLNNIST